MAVTGKKEELERLVSAKKLLIEPAGGLGNRLLFISSVCNLVKDCDITDITLIWRNNNECGCDFEDVIESLPIPCRVKNIHFSKETYKYLLKHGNLFGIIYKLFFDFFYGTFRKRVSKISLPIYQGMPVEKQKALKSVIYNSQTEKVYIEGYYQFYGELDLSSVSFNKDIVDRVNEYKHKNGQYDAMHIRRTDNVDAIKQSPTELFYRKIDEIITRDSEHRIYLATDDAGIQSDLMSKYPANILPKENGPVSRLSVEGMKFALYEMLILAGADTIYASFGSTFTIIANAIGRKEMIVLKND